MSPDSIWRYLGIEATQDGKAIRRAYAAKLRAIDPDQDRDGFAALREARDLALALAAQSTEDAPSSDATVGVEMIIPSAALPLIPPCLPAEEGQAGDCIMPAVEGAMDWQAPPLAPDCRAPGADDDAVDLRLPEWTSPIIVPHAAVAEIFDESRADHALHALLYPDPDADTQGDPMTQAEVDAGAALLDRLHDEAQTGEIDLHSRIEAWLSNILAGSWPRSHPLLAHAVALFGWAAKEGQIDAPPAIDYINRRLASDRFAQAVQDKAHPLHGAWKQLLKPTRPGQGRALWWQGDKIDELIATIRRDYPELEQRLNWHRIAIWEDHRARPIRWWTIAVGIIFALQLLYRIASSIYHPDPPATMVVPHVQGGLEDIDADMRLAVQAALGNRVSISVLQTDAPLVYQLFESNWRVGRELGRTKDQYVEQMVALIRHRYALLARQAGGNKLEALQRHRLWEEQWLVGQKNWAACTDTSHGIGLASADLIPADGGGLGKPSITGLKQTAKVDPAIAALILKMPDDPSEPRTRGTFPIPGKIVEKTVKASGLSLKQVKSAFQGKGNDREKCLTHIALLNATLAADEETRAAILPHI